MKIKDRVDDFRGLKALWPAPLLLAGINLDFGLNRWLGLIRLASSS